MAKTLNLTLKSKWYDLIEAGIKKEEYRDLKPFWAKRLVNKIVTYNSVNCIDGIGYVNEYNDFTHVHFARGGHFHPRLPQMTLEFKGIEIRTGNLEWGAEPGKEYFVIKLGELLKSEIGGSNG